VEARTTLTWSAVVGALMLGLVLWPRVSRAPAARPAVPPTDAGEAASTAADAQAATERAHGESAAIVAALAPLHRPKTPPKPGDWLRSFDEPGQTFAQYRAKHRGHRHSARTTLYVQTLGPFASLQEAALKDTVALLSTFYAAPTKMLAALGLEVVPLAATRERGRGRQLSTRYILHRVLAPNRPDDAVAVLAMTTSDLTPGAGWNFVFGEASLEERVGIWSVHRYGDPNQNDAAHAKFRRRMFKVALHETGHMLGILHCTAHECVMNGSNHLQEMDGSPMWLCPQCVQKVALARGVDLAERYAELAKLAAKLGLVQEESHWRASHAALTQAGVEGHGTPHLPD
jgi:archaemetzincin